MIIITHCNNKLKKEKKMTETYLEFQKEKIDWNLITKRVEEDIEIETKKILESQKK